MDESSRYMESKAQRPENNENNENGPEHSVFRLNVIKSIATVRVAWRVTLLLQVAPFLSVPGDNVFRIWGGCGISPWRPSGLRNCEE